MSEGTDGAFLLKTGNESVLEFVRNEVAAFGIHALRQYVSHFVRYAVLSTDLSPECLHIGICRTSGLLVLLYGSLRLCSCWTAN